MILLHTETCWVGQPDGTRVPFCGAALAGSICRAAGPANEETALLAESIAGAVEQYAREQAADRLVTTAEIAEMVEALLEMLGLETLADAYAGRAQPAEIALDRMAGDPGTGFELAFYRQLDAALGAAADQRGGQLRLRGLRGCVLRLRGARRWGDGCRRLAEEIVQYVYARAARLRETRPAALSVSVIE